MAGLQSIGQIGQSLADKRLKIAQALAVGNQFGLPPDVSKNMDVDQIMKIGAIKKGYIPADTFLQGLHAQLIGTQPVLPASGTAQPQTNGAILASNTNQDQNQPPAGQAAPQEPSQPTMQQPPRMLNPAEQKFLQHTADIAIKNRPQNVIQYTPGKGLEVVGTKAKGDQVITSQMNPMLSASWETASDPQKALAKAMYEGRVRPSDISFRERGVTTLLANEYANMNGLPPFKAYNADVNATMAKFSTSGKLGQNALSLNTALGHAASAFDSYQAIQNTNQQWLNTPINKLKKATNDPNVVALGINLNALQGELANVFKNSGATDQEIAHWKDYLNENLTPSQYVGALSKVDELLKSRLSAMEYQRGSAGGGGQPMMSPHASEISNRLAGQQQSQGIPQIGETFQGGKVLSIKRVK